VSGEEVNNMEKELTSVLKARKKLAYGRTGRKLNGWMQVKNELIIKWINFLIKKMKSLHRTLKRKIFIQKRKLI